MLILHDLLVIFCLLLLAHIATVLRRDAEWREKLRNKVIVTFYDPEEADFTDLSTIKSVDTSHCESEVYVRRLPRELDGDADTV